ncbi:hypothetical protein [Paenibacillus sp. Z6-24]
MKKWSKNAAALLTAVTVLGGASSVFAATPTTTPAQLAQKVESAKAPVTSKTSSTMSKKAPVTKKTPAAKKAAHSTAQKVTHKAKTHKTKAGKSATHKVRVHKKAAHKAKHTAHKARTAHQTTTQPSTHK